MGQIMNTVTLYNSVKMPAIMLGPGMPVNIKAKGLLGFDENSILSRAWKKVVMENVQWKR
jgi:hypothetical protein